MVVQSGIAKSREAKMHVEALRQLAESLDAEMEPLLIEVESASLAAPRALGLARMAS